MATKVEIIREIENERYKSDRIHRVKLSVARSLPDSLQTSRIFVSESHLSGRSSVGANLDLEVMTLDEAWPIAGLTPLPMTCVTMLRSGRSTISFYPTQKLPGNWVYADDIELEEICPIILHITPTRGAKKRVFLEWFAQLDRHIVSVRVTIKSHVYDYGEGTYPEGRLRIMGEPDQRSFTFYWVTQAEMERSLGL